MSTFFIRTVPLSLGVLVVTGTGMARARSESDGRLPPVTGIQVGRGLPVRPYYGKFHQFGALDQRARAWNGEPGRAGPAPSSYK